MKLKWLLLALLAIGSSTMAATIARWDFSESFATDGVSLPYATDGAFMVSATDKSGNGNDLSIWADSATSDRTWISTTASYFGDLAVQSPGGGNYGDMRTVNNSVPGGVDISASTFTPTNFTVEAVFTHEQLGWQVLAMRQGNLSGNMPSFRLLVNSGGRPQVAYRTQAGTQTELTAPTALPVSATDWHHMAVTAQGGSNLVLYVDGFEVASGSITNAGMEFDPNSGAGTDQNNTWKGGEWAVGRGMWVGSKSDGWAGKIDEVVISDEVLVPTNFVIPLAVSQGEVVPTQGTYTSNRTVSATMSDFGDHLDELVLYVNDNQVTYTNSALDQTTHTVVYQGTSIEFPAGSYTGMVVGVSYTTGLSYTNEWDFNFIDAAPEPAPYASELYNINYAGRTSANTTVPNGTVLKAPSLSVHDRWNNLVSPGENAWDSWTPASPLAITNAYGTNTISLTWSGSAHDWSNSGWGYADLFNGYLGSSGFDGNMIISGLDTNASYDIYCYFTWGWTTSMSTFSITEGTASVASATVSPVQANAGSYTNLVEGQNYAVFAGVVPSESGGIQIRSQNSDGGWSGLQIVKRSDVPPSIIVPYLDGPITPANGSLLSNSVVNVSGTLYDSDAGIDEISLYLDGNLVTNAIGLFTGGTSTNSLSYAATSLSNGLHTVMVTGFGYGYADAEGYFYTNSWTFSWFDHFAEPSLYAEEVYNLNFAGNNEDGACPVANGTILMAPVQGGVSVWNNWISPDLPWSYPGQPFGLANALGVTGKGVMFTYSGDSWNDGPQTWAGYYNEFLAMSNTIWGASQGDNLDDGICEFTGLDTNGTYDVYVYFTYNRNDSQATYTLSKGTANLPSITLQPDRLLLVSNSTDYVEGVNYGVIAEVTPNSFGAIAVSKGNYSALQLVKRSDTIPFVPYIDGAFLPASGYYTDAVVQVSGTLYDFDASIDELHLYLDGGEVDSTLGIYGSGTATVSYAAASLGGGMHSAMVTATGYGLTDPETYVYTNEWTFFISSEDSVPTTLIHHWDFMDGGGTNVTDVVGGANGAIIGENYTWSDQGGLILPGGGSGADWNNTNSSSAGSYVDLPNGIMSNLTGEVTIEATYISQNTSDLSWSRVYSFGASTEGEGISGEGAGQAYLTPYNGSVGHLEFSGGAAFNFSRVPVGHISHVVWVLDPDNYYSKCYVNGVLAGTVIGAIAPLSNLNDINNWFGRSQWSDNMFNGELLDIRIYEGVMTAAEAVARYGVVAPAPEVGPAVSLSSAGGLSISWPDDGYSYIVLTNSDLVNGAWGEMVVTPVLDGGTYTVTNLIGADTELFYKLQYNQ